MKNNLLTAFGIKKERLPFNAKVAMSFQKLDKWLCTLVGPNYGESPDQKKLVVKTESCKKVINKVVTEREVKRKISFYTANYKYFISAIVTEKGLGYLGATVSCRKSRKGETWLRGHDLPDGKFTARTWKSIVNSITQNEIILLDNVKEHK